MAESDRIYPGLDITWPSASSTGHPDSTVSGDTAAPDAPDDPDDPDDPMVGLVLATIDECGPIAVADVPGGVRVFFASPADRQSAADLMAAALPQCTQTRVDVADEHWAERSQASLKSVTVGALTIAPPWDLPEDRSGLVIIQPSMGFGTGHHASTRLCLRLLQDTHVPGARVLDAGTGSGVLAIAAWRLQAASVVAVDFDPDAVACARESAELNGLGTTLDIRQCDLDREPHVAGAPFSLILANLTGGMLIRMAARLLALLTPGGTLIVSGVTREEESAVIDAFVSGGATPSGRALDDQDLAWVGLRFTSPTSPTPASARQ